MTRLLRVSNPQPWHNRTSGAVATAAVRVRACRPAFAWHHGIMSNESPERYYHGTCADLKPGDLIERSYNSNFGSRKEANHVYLTATVDAAIWGAELAIGEGPGRIYIVEPTGPIEDDPNSRTRNSPATRRSRTALATRHWSWANSRTGKGTPPMSFRR